MTPRLRHPLAGKALRQEHAAAGFGMSRVQAVADQQRDRLGNLPGDREAPAMPVDRRGRHAVAQQGRERTCLAFCSTVMPAAAKACAMWGDDHEPRAFNTFSASPSLPIGKLLDTLTDRTLSSSSSAASAASRSNAGFASTAPGISASWRASRCAGCSTMASASRRPSQTCRPASSTAPPTTGVPCWRSPTPPPVSGRSGRARRRGGSVAEDERRGPARIAAR